MRTVPLILSALITAPALAQSGGPYSLTWSTIDSGGGTSTGAGAAGPYQLSGTIGQHDAANRTTGPYKMSGGFWAGITGGTTCYANCDGSTTQPTLNVDDFTCFINQYAQAQSLPHAQQQSHYANCDNSTTAPILNVDDFTCFINQYALGCP